MNTDARVKLLVVIVNYRVAPLVIDCLRSIKEELARAPGTRVTVCENGSGDNSAEIIQRSIDENSWHSWCSLSVSKANLGFTGGNNVLIRPALQTADPPDYILLLNPDTVVRPDAFKALVDFMDQNPMVGIAGSRLEDPDATPQRSAFRFQTPLSEFEGNLKIGPVSHLLKKWIVAPPVVDHAFETDWVSGASMIVRGEVFKDIGLLDEGFFTYFDDIDFCFNARKHGWSSWYVPASRIVHLVGQSTGVTKRPKRLPPYLFDARRRYLKNHGPTYTAMADALGIVGLVLFQIRGLLTGKNDDTPPHMLSDTIRHSVFLRGFKISDVKPPTPASLEG